jgi:monothiol glutaredoxin
VIPRRKIANMKQKLQITAYLKPSCGWSNGVRAVLEKYALPYEEKDITISPQFRLEMEQRSKQSLSPCVVVNGHMLADISGEELEHYLLSSKLVEDVPHHTTSVPLNSPCCVAADGQKKRA